MNTKEAITTEELLQRLLNEQERTNNLLIALVDRAEKIIHEVKHNV